MASKYSFWSDQGILVAKKEYYSFNFGKSARIHETDLKLVQKHGKVFGTLDFGTLTLNCADHDLIKEVLIKDFFIFINRKVIIIY